MAMSTNIRKALPGGMVAVLAAGFAERRAIRNSRVEAAHEAKQRGATEEVSMYMRQARTWNKLAVESLQELRLEVELQKRAGL